MPEKSELYIHPILNTLVRCRLIAVLLAHMGANSENYFGLKDVGSPFPLTNLHRPVCKNIDRFMGKPELEYYKLLSVYSSFDEKYNFNKYLPDILRDQPVSDQEINLIEFNQEVINGHGIYLDYYRLLKSFTSLLIVQDDYTREQARVGRFLMKVGLANKRKFNLVYRLPYIDSPELITLILVRLFADTLCEKPIFEGDDLISKLKGVNYLFKKGYIKLAYKKLSKGISSTND